MGKRAIGRFLLALCVSVLGTSAAHADHIINSETGGDCAAIGTWDSATATCTLTRNVHEPIVLLGHPTLDGNGHSIAGPGPTSALTGVTCDAFAANPCGDVTIENVTVTGFQTGIAFLYTAGTIKNTIISGNEIGIQTTRGRACPTIANNVIKGNGIALAAQSVECGVVANNRFADNRTLFQFFDLVVLSIYNNNFIDNGQADPPNVFFFGQLSLPSPTGGNYWSEFRLPSQGCVDLNGNGVCDAPFPGVFTSPSCPQCERDNLPWTQPNGWFLSDVDNLLAAKERACDLGWISKKGVCLALGARLWVARTAIKFARLDVAASQLEAFLNLLRAQNGKAVNREAYVLLSAGAQSLIDRLQP